MQVARGGSGVEITHGPGVDRWQGGVESMLSQSSVDTERNCDVQFASLGLLSYPPFGASKIVAQVQGTEGGALPRKQRAPMIFADATTDAT